jgi:hypothetical protein
MRYDFKKIFEVNMKKNIILILSVITSVNLYASSGLSSSFEFMKIDQSPRISATAGAFLSMRNDPNALFVNPAGLAYLDVEKTSFNYVNYLLDITAGSAVYSAPIADYGVMGLGFIFMDYGHWKEVDENVVETGRTFSVNDFGVVMGFSGNLDKNFAYGVNFKYAYSRIDNHNASALLFDFGLLWEAPFENNLYFAATLTNIGKSVDNFGSREESLPLSFNFSVSKKLDHLPLELSVSMNDLTASQNDITEYLRRFSVGGEFTLSSKLRLRFGYENSLNQSLRTSNEQKFGGINVGLGFEVKSFHIDYSYSHFSALGSVHRFGILMNINALKF